MNGETTVGQSTGSGAVWRNFGEKVPVLCFFYSTTPINTMQYVKDYINRPNAAKKAQRLQTENAPHLTFSMAEPNSRQ